MLHPCRAAVARDLRAWKQLKSKNQQGREGEEERTHWYLGLMGKKLTPGESQFFVRFARETWSEGKRPEQAAQL